MDAVLVCGSESSGNRLITRILKQSGFTDVSGTETEYRSTKRWQNVCIPDGANSIVWLRSVPHDGEWPDLWGMVKLLRARGYRVSALVPMRDWWCTAQSQVRATHVATTDEALGNLRVVASTIFTTLTALAVPFAVVSYEHLIQRPATTLKTALQINGITVNMLTIGEAVRDENAKWM